MTANLDALVKLNAGECSGDQGGAIALWGYTTQDLLNVITADGYFNSIADDVNPGSYIFINRPKPTTFSYILRVTSLNGAEPVTTEEVKWGKGIVPVPWFPTLHEFATDFTTSGNDVDTIAAANAAVANYVTVQLNDEVVGSGPPAQPLAIAYAKVTANNVVSIYWRATPTSGQTARIWISLHSNVPHM